MTLQHIDSAIAFAVVMLGASLLITVMTQSVSTLFNLRGRQLQRALGDLLETAFPKQVDDIEALAKEILEHPLISDSSFGSGDPNNRERQYRWPATIGAALLVAVAVGSAVGMLEQRAWLGLVWGAGSGVAAAFVVFLNSDRWELASALRIEELTTMLKHVSENGTNKAAATTIRAGLKAVEDLDERLTKVKALTASCRASMQDVADRLKAQVTDPAVNQLVDVILAAVGTSEERKAHLTALKAMVSGQVTAAAEQLGALAAAELTLEQELAALPEKIRVATDAKLKRVEVLFNAAMDRASSRFTVYSRLVTVVCSVALAFVVHLDAVELFKRLSSDAELRAKLVGSSEAMMKQADEILGAAKAAPAPAASAAPASSAAPMPSAAPPPPQEQLQTEKDQRALEECLAKGRLKSRVPALYATAMFCPKRLAFLAPNETPGPFPTRADALDYLEKHVIEKKAQDEARKDYGENLGKLLDGKEMAQLFDHAASINGELSRSGVELWPSPYPGWPKWKEIPGLIAAAVFLSLGAPFWFNMLKTLTNLRPLVATREERDRQMKQAKAA
jgi:hypothetical protein